MESASSTTGAAPALTKIRLETAGPWHLLPTLGLSDGGRARRLNALFSEHELLSVVLTTSGKVLGVSFELVERRAAADHAPDPRLGRVTVDGRTLCFGLVETSRGALTFSALSTEADDRLVLGLRHGETLLFEFAERVVQASLATFASPFATALRSVCDPNAIPVRRWLEG
jgi:hypothetical protein